MSKRVLWMAALAVAVFPLIALAQSDRGTITGTVSDSSGAVVPSVAITVKNTETGAVYETMTTATGNYTLAQLPAGVYEETAASAGFSKYVQVGITVQVAQTLRVDVVLQVGSAAESVTVNADAPLLRTDGSDVSHNVTYAQVDDLPLFTVEKTGSAGGGTRSPYAFIDMMPGATLDWTGSTNIRVNGLPNGTYSTRVDGQEATFTQQPNSVGMTAPAVDSLEEVTLQTSTFAAEYGQFSGGLFNFTSKSGTNQLHGNGFEFLKDEFMNAGQPFTNDGQGHLIRPKARSNNYGGSVGGPVYIPRLYNGHDKTFFYLNIDWMKSGSMTTGTYVTVPTTAMRNGNFSAISTGRNLATDTQGHAILENTIYDPATLQTVNGAQVTTPFPGNIIPQTRFDPVAVKIQNLLPQPTTNGLINNWSPSYYGWAVGRVFTSKVDENISAKSKASFYFSLRTPHGPGKDGLPVPISAAHDSQYYTPTFRLNYDRTVTPELLVHVGVGFIRSFNLDRALLGDLQYDAPGQLGLVGGVVTNNYGGAPATGMPGITGLNSSYGGFYQSMGVTGTHYYYLEKPTGVLSVMRVRSNHTYKVGAEWRKDAHTDRSANGSQGLYNFSNLETGLPSTNGQSLGGGAVGFSYASFLLGLVDSASVATPQDPQFRKTAWGLYAQDTWKVTRRLTFDYGLRWDYQTALTELHDRIGAFSPTTPNPSAGGLLGGMAYAGSGTGRIGGQFTKNYPYAIGPRLGVAWQINAKTVLRGGWGLTYGQTANYGYISNTSIVGVGFNQLLWTSPSYGSPAVVLSQGLQYTQQQLYAVSLNPGIRPTYGQIQSPPYWLDPNGGRPPRINGWSVGLQREITRNLIVEAAYVGNRSVWDQTASSLVDLNALTPERIRAAGLNINTAADRTLLTSRMDSAVAQSRGFSTPLYPGYPLSTTVAQSLRPYPQFSTIPVKWSPLGNSWYDSLQSKVTKRSSHGLTAWGAFTFSKEETLGEAPVNNVFNRQVQKTISPSSLPFVMSIAMIYEIPRMGPNRWIRLAIGGWAIQPILRYQSGLPILVPAAQNALSSVLFRSTFANRVPGVPLFTHDLNCKCFDPNKTFVLNPAAWSDPAPGQWGTAAAYYNDYRYERRPIENLSLARSFRMRREGMRLEIRVLFNNPFNRTYMNNPDSTNALATQSVNAAGQVVSGFGRINTASTWAGQRNGLLEGRFEF